MTDELIKAVADAVASFFAEDGKPARVFTEEVRQDIKPPAFFVGVDKVGMEKIGVRRFFKKTDLYILYIANQNLSEVGDLLFEALEYIDFKNGIVAGKDMTYTIQDDILRFQVSFERELFKMANPPNMQKLHLEQVMKNERD